MAPARAPCQTDSTVMVHVRTRRSRVLRGFALAASAAPICVAWILSSCVLADPPPTLPTIPPAMPSIVKASMTPPAGTFTGWPTGAFTFGIAVQVINPTDAVHYAMVEDDGTPAASLLQTAHTAGPGNYGQITLDIAATAPGDGNCHTFTLYVDAIEDASWQAYPPSTVTCDPNLCNPVTWLYEPASGAGCPAFDAGAALGRDGSADAAR